MAKISYDAAQSLQNEDRGVANRMSFFYLKGAGDEALVRFMIDSVEDIDLLTVHTVEIDGKYRNINCLREAYDPIDTCPLCVNNTKISGKAYIRMIKYDRDDRGAVVATPCVWERGVSYAKTIKSLLDEYGPLNHHLFKIKRDGTGLDTTYSILYAPPTIYKPEMYPANISAFADFDASKMIMSKTAEELSMFLSTGQFPKKERKDEDTVTTPRPTLAAPAGMQQAMPAPPMFNNPMQVLETFTYAPSVPISSAAPNYAAPEYQAPPTRMVNPADPMGAPAPWDTNYQPTAPGIERPARNPR